MARSATYNDVNPNEPELRQKGFPKYMDYVVQTDGLTKKYGKQTAVDNVNVHVKQGAIYGLLGRNGAGKTTIMKMLLGLASVDSGEAFIFGHPLQKIPQKTYERIGNIVETPGFYPNLTGYENLKVFAKLKGMVSKSAIEDALAFVSLPCGDKKPFSNYSLGMKQRLGIANALMNDPELLILDEPTNGLDPIGIAEIRGLIKELSASRGKTVLISSHYLSEIEQIADTIGIIHEGVLLEECDMQDISRHNQRHINIEVPDVKNAVLLLEEKLGIKNYTVVQPDTIKIYDFTIEPKIINSLFCGSGLEVSALYINAGNLEEHFRTITGGVGIA